MLYFEKEKSNIEKIYNNEINEIIQELDYFVKKKSKKRNTYDLNIDFIENKNNISNIFYIFILIFLFLILYFRKYFIEYLEKLII